MADASRREGGHTGIEKQKEKEEDKMETSSRISFVVTIFPSLNVTTAFLPRSADSDVGGRDGGLTAYWVKYIRRKDASVSVNNRNCLW